MDRLYRVLSHALEKLSTIEDLRFADTFRNFVATLEDSFRQEEAWLEEMQCPSVWIHLEEHARTLSSLHRLHSRIMAGEISEGREVVQNVLPQWLAFHIATMDFVMTHSFDQVDSNEEPASVFIETSGSSTLRQDRYCPE